MKVTFELRKPPDKHGKCRIRAVACFMGKRVRIATGNYIAEKNWDKTSYKAKRNSADSASINASLADIEARLSELYHRHKHLLTAEIIQNAFKDDKPPLQHNFFEILEKFLAVSPFTESRKNGYRALARHLKSFETEYRYPITFESITQDFYDKFREYALAIPLQNSTFARYIKALKAFMRWSSETWNYHTNLVFKRFKAPKEQKKHQLSLTEEELLALETLDLSTPDLQHLTKSRDAFLFACYTGFRISDVKQLQAANIHNNEIKIITKKTKDALTIGFTNKTLPIWEKYQETGLIDIEEQTLNKHLKIIGQKAGLTNPIQELLVYGTITEAKTYERWEFLSFHVARRTFATLSFARNKMTAESIMQITGHKDLKTFYAYINYTPKMVNDEYQKTWN
ncbi:MAG: tyrosine-type recombinase/integrase [Candidatus Kapabacteria bacterium]|jgi:integrase|nr:tyrosine-type recombinase/integrase [Candidatus Kapabacteria bacterium]